MAVTPSNSYHYYGIAPQAAVGTGLPPVRFGKYKDFSSGTKKDTEDDEGHMGSRNMLVGMDVTTGSSEPAPGGKFRLDEEIGDYLRGFFGNVVSTQKTTTAAYGHVFSEDEELPPYSITHGFNVGSFPARRFEDCYVDGLDLKFNTKEAPTWEAKLKGNFPTFGVTEPTFSYTQVPPLMASHLLVYMDDYETGTIGTNLLTGFQEGDISVSNGLESDTEMGGGFGENIQDMGKLTGEGKIKRRHESTDHQRTWATGAADGTAPLAANQHVKLRYVLTGPMIKENNGTPTIHPYKFQFDILNAVITDISTSEDGDGPKNYEYSWKAMPNASQLSFAAEIVNKVTTYAPPG